VIDEGYIKFDCRWTESPPLDGDVVEEIIKWRRPLFDAGLVGHFADIGIGFGNISMRSNTPGRFIITGTQTGHLAELSGAHLAEVTDYDIQGNSLFCRGPVRASSESLTHAAIYELDPELNAVVHVHSDALWQALRDTVPTTDAAIPYGTPEMAQEFRRLYRHTDFASAGLAVMAGHEGGLISIGHDLARAASRFLDRDYSTSSMATGVSRNR
jgi:L-ribulose-5-phosphate 4-epimerase